MANKLNTLKNKSLFYAFLATSIAAAILILCIFLPYGSAIGENADYLKERKDVVLEEDLNLEAGDLLHISMIEFARIYFYVGEMLDEDWIGILYTVLVSVIFCFAFLTLLFALLKKPIATIIFDILAFVVFSFENWSYTDRGVIPGDDFGWGIGYYLFFVASAVVLGAAIWMLVAKIQDKKRVIQVETGETPIWQQLT